MTNKIFCTLVCLCLLVCTGCQDNKQREFNIKMIDNDSRANGGVQGWKDGSNGLAYGYGYDDILKGFTNESEQERKEYQEHYSKGYKIGYDQEYAKAKKEYDNKHKAVQANRSSGDQYGESTTIQSIPSTYSTPETYSYPELNRYTLHTDESIYGDYYNYKETNNCVEGVVVYEGTGTNYIVETKKGYTVMEDYSGSLFEGAKVRGELNQYNFKYLINRNKNQEIKVYIEDYMLSDKKAIELLGKKNRLKPNDQSAYDANNE